MNQLNQKESKKRVTITLDPDLLEEIDNVGRDRGLSRSALLRLAWQAYSGRGSIEDAAIAEAARNKN